MIALILTLACGTTAPAVPSVATASAEFRNAEGQLVCPVMGDVIADVEHAQGSAELDGKTYYFCCDSCSRTFAADPVRYKDGAFLAHLGKEHGGKWAECSHPL